MVISYSAGAVNPVPNDELGEIPHLKSVVPWKSAVTQKKQDAKILGEDGKVEAGAKRKWRRENVKKKPS